MNATLSSKPEIKEIPAEETYAIRLEVLRPGMPKSSVYFDEDHNEGSFHLGAFVSGDLAAIVSLSPKTCVEQPTTKAYQLRGMASLPKHQGQGLGKALIDESIHKLQERDCDLLWCNARQVAYKFYEKMDFKFLSPEFDIPTVGPHRVMARALKI